MWQQSFIDLPLIGLIRRVSGRNHNDIFSSTTRLVAHLDAERFS